MYPSLLWIQPPEGRYAAPRQCFVDCGLTLLLPEAAIEQLRTPATTGELARRHRLFTLLREKNTQEYSSLLTWEEHLSTLSAAHHGWVNAKTPLERLFLRARLLAVFSAAAESLASLIQAGILPDDLSAARTADAGKREALRLALAGLPTVAAPLTSHILRFEPEAQRAGLLTPLPSPTAPIPLTERLSACAAALNLTLPSPKPSALRLDDAFSSAILSRCPEAGEAFAAALAPFDALPVATLLLLRDELSFCRDILALAARAEAASLPVILPRISPLPRYHAKALCDVSLLSANPVPTVTPNDADFEGERRFFFLTGANGGGKTTYLRAVCGNLLLFLGGCPIFADDAEIYPWQIVLTHFPSDERFSDSGRFAEEEARVADMLNEMKRAGGEACFFCFNETYSGTDRAKGSARTIATARAVADAGGAGLFVTHFHEAAEAGLPILRAIVDGEDNRRTFRITADHGKNSSYATDILRKYRIDAVSLAARRKHTEKEGI